MRLPTTLFSFLWYFVKKQKGLFFFIQFLCLAWSLDNTVWPYAIKLLLDKMTTYQGAMSGVWAYLTPTLLLWISLWISIEIMFRVSGFLMAYVLPRFGAAIRLEMFSYVSNHSYGFFANHFAGNISNKISDMTQSATQIVQWILTLFIPVFIAIIIATAVFSMLNPFFAALLFSYTVLHTGTCLLTAKYCSRLSSLHAEARSTLTGKIVDSFSNIINVKLFSKQRYEFSYIQKYQQDEQQKHQASQMAIEKIKIALGIITLLFPGFAITGYLVYSWQHGQLTIGDVVLILNTTSNITTLTWIVSLELPNFFKEIGVCNQALTIIKAQHDITDQYGAAPMQIKKGEIAFDQVSFYYHKSQPIFSNLSLTIPAGKKMGLVGFSGGGKSTFVNLIMRFFDVQSGRITIDGVDITRMTLESLRTQISMIPQNPTLFHRSIRDNICYGQPAATDADIIRAAKQAHCHDFITRLPEGYHTLVGERGIKLSGGQRQRIAIARAILEDHPILILDEATSSLDSVTEKYIQDALNFLMKDRTTIVIAHRLSTLSEMDHLLVFNEGRVIEEGDHHHLLKLNGHYAQMWHMQAGGFLPDTPEGPQPI